MTFRALVIDKAADSAISQVVKELSDDLLPEGDVTLRIDYSTLNYKDGLCMHGQGGLVRTYPHIPGVDFSGVVESSDDPRYRPDDRVVLTGWRVGEVRWGGYATRARVKADWLVRLPDAISNRQAMAVGTAGLTSMWAVMALEKAGLTPDKGEVLVTGAAGGVGSVAVALLAKLGFTVAAVTGRPEMADYLRGLGAASIIDRSELADAGSKPLESERWAASIDAVGGEMLAKVLKQMKYNGSVASIGLAAGAAVPSFTVIPFLLRGVNLLGIDSVMRPYADRVEAWNRVASDLPMDRLDAMISEHGLEDMPALGTSILRGGVKGRVVVNPNL